MVLTFILIYFGWRDTENQQLAVTRNLYPQKQKPWERGCKSILYDIFGSQES